MRARRTFAFLPIAALRSLKAVQSGLESRRLQQGKEAPLCPLLFVLCLRPTNTYTDPGSTSRTNQSLCFAWVYPHKHSYSPSFLLFPPSSKTQAQGSSLLPASYQAPSNHQPQNHGGQEKHLHDHAPAGPGPLLLLPLARVGRCGTFFWGDCLSV